jgi:hypothetical protein
LSILPAPPGNADTPLVMEHGVTNLPSASVLAELRRQALARVFPPQAVAALADPVFDSRDERIGSSYSTLDPSTRELLYIDTSKGNSLQTLTTGWRVNAPADSGRGHWVSRSDSISENRKYDAL